MENYDSSIIRLLTPLLVVQTPSDDEPYKMLVNNFKLFDILASIWDNSILKNRLLSNKYSIRHVITSEDKVLSQLSELQNKGEGTHDEFSPFNVHSDLFPNGILSTKWFEKYTSIKPFALIQTYDLDQYSDDELSEVINKQKNAYAEFNVKFVAIAVSNSDPDADEIRLTKIRQATGMTRLAGLIYLNLKTNLEKSSEVLVTSLMLNLKNAATEFYIKIEQRIKQRHKKYYSVPSSNSIDTTIELTPKFLETRNTIKLGMIHQFISPSNLEGSISYLENSYQSLILLSNENFFQFTKDKISSHDLKIYFQFRNLIDALALHIVRVYLSIEDPITALKKHMAHILNVTSMVNNKIDLKQWTSIQYEWLGQLLDLLPKTILTNTNIRHYKKLHSNKIVGFFGGVRFKDDNIDVLMNPSLIYFTASKLLSKSQVTNDELNFLQIYDTEAKLKAKKMELLTLATKTKEELQNRYICFQLAEEYYHAGAYEQAVELYSQLSSSQWKSLQNSINSRIVDCYEKLGKYDELLAVVLQSQQSNVSIDFKSITSFELKESLFEIQALLIDEKALTGLKDPTTIFDKLICQVDVKSKVNPSLGQLFKGDVQVYVTIDKLTVEFEKVDKPLDGFKNKEIIHNASLKDEKYQVVDTDANMIITNEKVIEFLQVVEKSGTYRIKAVGILSTILLVQDDNTVTISNSEEHKLYGTSLFDWYYKHIDGNLIKTPVPSTKSVKVLPIRPDVSLAQKSPTKAIIVGEKVSLPFKIKFLNKEKLNYNRILISPRVRIVEENADDESLIDASISWGNFKDDEPIILDDYESIDLNVLAKSASLTAEDILATSNKSFKLSINLNILIEENQDNEMIVYDLESFDLSVLSNPFKCKFTVSPKFREEKFNDMPNPFIVKEDDKGSNHSMPIVTRYWQGNLSTINNLEALNGETLEISNIEYDIKSKNPDILVGIVDQTSNNLRLFTTKSKNGISHRNVTISVSVLISWKRTISATVNNFRSQEWEIILPLSDPRVLLSIEKQQEKMVKLDYILENPTPRIFTFNYKLVDENDRFVWNFDDDRNLMPLVQQRFPVLPFSRYRLTFYSQYNSPEVVVKLPQFKVFDVQYKVTLPTLPVSRDILIRDNTLFWRRE